MTHGQLRQTVEKAVDKIPGEDLADFLVGAEFLRSVLVLLRKSNEPLTAAEIAESLEVSGNRESQRRRVRWAIQTLRDTAGQWIVATLQDGYLLTDDAHLWREYNEGRKIDGKKLIGKAHRQELIADSQGQGLLFQPQTARIY